jgi:hypothetical protein
VNVNSANQVSLVGETEMQDPNSGPDYFTATLANYQDPNAAGSTAHVTVTATCATVANSATAAPAAKSGHSGIVNRQALTRK